MKKLISISSFIPIGFGPPETERQLGSGGLVIPLTQTVVYTHDNLYRLTEADYTFGESYAYSYDSVNDNGNLLNSDTLTNTFDAATA